MLVRTLSLLMFIPFLSRPRRRLASFGVMQNAFAVHGGRLSGRAEISSASQNYERAFACECLFTFPRSKGQISTRRAIPPKRVLLMTVMAASPVTLNGNNNVQDSEKWAASNDPPVEVQQPADTDPTGAPGPRPDDHHDSQAQSVERKDASPAPTNTTSGGKLDAPHRGEKQIKVLVRSSLIPL